MKEFILLGKLYTSNFTSDSEKFEDSSPGERI